jgi:hypothetical protein
VLARRFLYVFAALIVLVLVAGICWTLFPQAIMRARFVPGAPYVAPPAAGAPDYMRPNAWLARPDMRDDPAQWLPPGMARGRRGNAEIFFVPPTTFLDKGRWNAPYDDPEADARARTLVRSQASAFSGVGRVWAPRYRQATVGAFLAAGPDSTRAINLAYSDVERAFHAFVAQIPAEAPIILAAHSQGSLHLMRLIAERLALSGRGQRVVAAYLVGWPVSTTADLPALGMPACAAPDETHCVLGWESFAEPADASQQRALYDATTGLTGAPRARSVPLCVDPLSGAADGASPASANPGSLVPTPDYASATLTPALVGARCRPDGLLSIGDPPAGFGGAVLPGNNYHVFDYALFWSAIRADAARRLAAFEAKR